LAFAREVACSPTGLLAWRDKTVRHKTAIFRQINKDKAAAHHDALEFPDGQIVLLTCLDEVSKLRFCSYRQSPRLPKRVNCKNACYVG
jgi:hypothetical protein